MKGMYQVTRRFITLVEIMIVMTLIAMILGVVAYNYQGALNEGRAFETRANIEKIRTVLTLKIAQDPNAINELSSKWGDYVKASPLITNPDKLKHDAWGGEFKVSADKTKEGQVKIEVRSENLDAYEGGRSGS